MLQLGLEASNSAASKARSPSTQTSSPRRLVDDDDVDSESTDGANNFSDTEESSEDELVGGNMPGDLLNPATI